MAMNKNTYPSKKTINLCIKEKPAIDPLKALPLILLVLIAVAAFGKFAVLDRLNAMTAAQARVNEAARNFNMLAEEYKSYEGVEEEYEHYSVGWMAEDEKNLVERTKMLDLINDEVLPSAKVTNIGFTGNTISVQLKNTNLSDVSALVELLNKRDDVEKVAVYTANVDEVKYNKDKEKLNTTNVSLVITMKAGGDK